MKRKKYQSTKSFARTKLVQPDTVRRSYCTKGHYFGIVPQKLPNGRLAWPDENE